MPLRVDSYGVTAVFGTRSAAALDDVGLRFDAIVAALMAELGLSYEEATESALDAQHRARPS